MDRPRRAIYLLVVPTRSANLESLLAFVVQQVLVLYLERSQCNRAHLHALSGALLIQRLEGSRPHGRLCTLDKLE